MTPAEFAAAFPAELKRLKRFIAWGPDPDSGRGKTPLLISAKSRRASTRKPNTWFDWAAAQAFYGKYAKPGEMGVGFVFVDGDGLVYLDIDDAVEDGALRPWAAPYVEPFLGKAYIEVSPSGHGLHVIARGKLPIAGCGGTASHLQHQSAWAKSLPKPKIPEVAIWASGKYTTLSGDVIDAGRALAGDCTAEVAQVWALAGIQASGADRAAGPPPSPDQLVTVDSRKVSQSVRAELRRCAAGDAADRSAARFRLYTEAAKTLEAEEIFSLVIQSDWYTGSGAEEKGSEATWQDIVRSCAKVETAAKDFAEFTEAQAEDHATQVVAWKDLGLPVVERVTKAGVEVEVAYGVQAMKRVLLRHPEWKGRLRRNSMSQQIELDGEPLSESVSDAAEYLRSYLRWEREPQLDLVRQAMVETAEAQAHNPVADELRALQWDGVDRISDWLVRAGCEDCEVTRVCGRKWIISLVARALRPGCKVDTVLILEGDQGVKKSSLLEALAGPKYFTDSSIAFERDDKLAMHKHWIVELSELSTFKRAEVEVVKNFISRKKDDFRAPYARAVASYPRHFVFVGTTNAEQYLEDPTGQRRYWPVRVTSLDVNLVLAEREQLLAQAVACLDAGEPWWFDAQPEALREAQTAREVVDPLEDAVDVALENCSADGSSPEFTLGAFLQLLGLSLDRKDLQMRVSAILRKKGYQRVFRRKPTIEGQIAKPQWIWRNPSQESSELAKILSISPASGAS